MKYTFSATVIAFAMTAAISSGATTSGPFTWQGDLFITTDAGTAAACIKAGITTGDLVQAIFAPKNVAASIPTNRFAVFFPRGSAHQIVPGSGTTTFSKATSVNMTHINHDASVTTGPMTLTPGQFQFSTVLIGTTQLFAVSGSFPDIGYGCKVTLNGVLNPRPGSVAD